MAQGLKANIENPCVGKTFSVKLLEREEKYV
jgi:hypothetical protein